MHVTHVMHVLQYIMLVDYSVYKNVHDDFNNSLLNTYINQT